MNTSLDHLPLRKRQQLEAITKIIVNAITPEKVLLFGDYTSATWGAGFHADNHLPVTYDILVITRPDTRRAEYEIQDMIENRCRFYAPVTIIVHDIVFVNKQIARGHYFFTTVRKEAILLFDQGAVPLAEGRPLDLGRIRMIAEQDFERWIGRARAFFKTATFSIRENEPKIAVFLLHQAAEHAYQAILLVFTGYKPCTHNLEKLRKYTYRFSIELGLLFPGHPPEEEMLFKLLLHGYVDARYNEDYEISRMELGILNERVGKLLSMATRLCQNRLLSLGKMSGFFSS
ncbi:MAG: HEPN domain-containing protein [Puia sp.]|nr:HEPN domain-containing protein [Puia sp.]